jgi:hypothetical protein
MEQEVRDTACNIANAFCEAINYIGDVSYAILPRNLAHDLGDLKKTFLGGVREAVDKEISWIDERVAGGDKMREEWKRRCQPEEAGPAAESAS